MSAIFRAYGDRIDHTPGAAVSAGQIIVLSSMLGYATDDIAAGRQGSLAIEGIVEVDKENVAFAVGEDVYYDEANGLAFAGSGIYMGKATKAAAADDDTVWVKIVHQEASASGTATGTGTAGD